jgi:hypothetical protein
MLPRVRGPVAGTVPFTTDAKMLKNAGVLPVPDVDEKP